LAEDDRKGEMALAALI